MNQANVDRAQRIKRGTQKVGHAHDERQAGREVLKKELEDTKLPAGSICDILIPLQNPKKSARANVDQRGLDDLIEKIKRSNQSDLCDVADEWNLIHDVQPVR